MKTILFVEDEQTLQKTLGDALSKVGYKVINAMDGETGLKLAQTKMPDLVLLDIVLPKKEGFEVLAALKEDPKTRDIPVIILTNLEKMEDIEKALRLGATTYLVKTEYALENVMEKIKKCLGE
jgi:CheY-like chemotaxis protein